MELNYEKWRDFSIITQYKENEDLITTIVKYINPIRKKKSKPPPLISSIFSPFFVLLPPAGADHHPPATSPLPDHHQKI